MLPALGAIGGFFSSVGSAVGGGISAAAGAISSAAGTVVIPTGVITSGGAAGTVTGITAGQIAGGLALAGTAATGAGSAISQGRALSGAYEYNAMVMEENAKRATAEAEYNRQQKLRKLRGVLGSQRASYGAAGLVAGTGSALDLAMDTQSQGDLEAAWIEYNGRAQSESYLAQANSYRRAASTATKQGWVNAGLTILGTAASAGLGSSFSSSLGKIGNITKMSGGFDTSAFASTMIA